MKTVARYVIGLALMAAFLYWAFRGLDLASVWQAAAAVSPAWLLLIVLTIVTTAFLRGWRWVVLLRPVAPQVTVLDATLALTICYSVNVVTPRMGEAARALSLKWVRGASVTAVLGTVVVERVIDLLWLLFFIALSAALLPGRIEAAFPWMQAAALTTLIGALLALAALLSVSAYGDRGVEAVRRLLAHLSARLAELVAELLACFIHGLAALRSPRAYAEILLSSALLNMGYVAIIYQAHVAFGFDGPPWHLGLPAAIVIMSISSIGIVVPAPGGTGTYHFFYGKSLRVLFGVPQAPAMACATLVHAVSNLTYLAIGVPALVLQKRRRRSAAATAAAEAAPGKPRSATEEPES